MLASHKKEWAVLWGKFDMKIKKDDFTQKVIRLHIYHLLVTASKHNLRIDAGLPARGLHGEAYRGHIFWDELYVMNFYDLHDPLIAEALLLYRYNRLPEARKYAIENGYKGSMFPWQSGSKGIEETQVVHLNPMNGKWGPDRSSKQRHVSFAVSYITWKHWERTGDKKFLSKYGAEMLLSVAKFGASLAYYSNADDKYHTDGVMGPDEFHEKLPGRNKVGFKDNAYTNIMIVWTLLKALKVLSILPARGRERIMKKAGVSDKDFIRWWNITDKMNIIINEKGIISQFDGYFSLKELDWEHYIKKYRNIHRMDRILKAEGKSPDNYKVAKQADVLMLFYLFSFHELNDIFERIGKKLTKKMIASNYYYYEKRTSHGSTLSKVVHCYIASLIGLKKGAWTWFQEVLKSDIYDAQGGTTSEGIHAGVMGGSIDVVRRAFAGVSFREDHVKVMPSLPIDVDSVEFNMIYKNIPMYFKVDKKIVEIKLKKVKGAVKSLMLELPNKNYEVKVGGTYKLRI